MDGVILEVMVAAGGHEGHLRITVTSEVVGHGGVHLQVETSLTLELKLSRLVKTCQGICRRSVAIFGSLVHVQHPGHTVKTKYVFSV